MNCPICGGSPGRPQPVQLGMCRSEFHTTSIYDEIRWERQRQSDKWGGSEHDAHHSGLEWVDFITRYAAWAGMMWLAGGKGRKKYRRRMMQIAALAVAACEAFDREEASE